MNTFIQLSNEDIDTALSHDLREEVRRCNKHITAMQARIEKLEAENTRLNKIIHAVDAASRRKLKSGETVYNIISAVQAALESV